MLRFIDVGTNLSAHIEIIAVLSVFSLFTAYQFLSPGKLVFTPESKMRPFPSCVYQRLCALMMEMIATSYFFAYCVSNFECWFYCERGLTIVQFQVTIQHLGKEDEAVLCYLLLDFPDHIVIISLCGVDHMWRLLCFFSTLCEILSLSEERFSGASTTPKSWPYDNHSVLGFDHIFDHKQIRSTRRQECTRVWKSRFCVAERAGKSKNG